jgi:hypothetical protein
VLGIADRGGRRRDILRELGMALARKGRYVRSEEECARWREDVLSIVPLMVVCAQLLIAPRRGRLLATRAIENYALSSQAAHQIRALAGDVL